MAADHAADSPYAEFGYSVAEAQPSERVAFVRKTYTHLAAAIYAFAALQWAYFQTGFAEWLTAQVAGAPWGMLVMFGLFIVVSWLANSWAQSETSVGMQYAGLFGYVVAQSLIFVPMLVIANQQAITLPGVAEAVVGTENAQVGVIPAAAITTLVVFGVLTAFAWLSGKDFSFLGAGLSLGSVLALVAIGASFLFGFHLGVWFSVAMVGFAAAYILYDTSNVMHHYRPGQHVAASLALFASVALLFWYVLRLFMNRD